MLPPQLHALLAIRQLHALLQNIVALPAKEGRAYRERESCALAVWLEGRDELSLLHIIALETTGRLPSAVRAERVEGKLYAHCAEIGKHKAVPMGAGGVVHAASGKRSSVSAPHQSKVGGMQRPLIDETAIDYPLGPRLVRVRIVPTRCFTSGTVNGERVVVSVYSNTTIL